MSLVGCVVCSILTVGANPTIVLVVEVWRGERSTFGSLGWMCTIPKDDGGAQLNRCSTLGSILVAKWVARSLEGFAPWQPFVSAGTDDSSTMGKVQGAFYLSDILSFPHLFKVSRSIIFQNIWLAGGSVAAWSSGIPRATKQGGIWRSTLYGVGGHMILTLQSSLASKLAD